MEQQVEAVAAPPRELLELAMCAGSVAGLPSPVGLGADVVLADQVESIAGSLAVLQRELAIRMALWERQAPKPNDTTGTVGRAGVKSSIAASLRSWGVLAVDHPAVATAWRDGRLNVEQVAALASMIYRLATTELRAALVERVVPLLPGLSTRASRRAIARAIEELQPDDPEHREVSDYARRSLVWGRAVGGGLLFEGYLPPGDGEALVSAITALAESMRVDGDGFSTAQRQADALVALLARATAHGLPTGGGLPVGVTLTIGLDEAARIAAADPAAYADCWRARPTGGATVDGNRIGQAMTRFGLCCAAITPALVDQPAAGGLLQTIAATPVQTLALGREVRLASTAQRRALQLRDGGCAIPGCAITTGYTQPHHVTPWSLGGPTDLDNLISLCYVHHRQTEMGIWTIAPRTSSDPRPELHEHPTFRISRR